jgi:hypothetical protein
MQYKNQISCKEAISMPQSKETPVKKPRKKPSAKEATSTLQGKETVVKKPTKKTSTKKTVARKPTKKPSAKETVVKKPTKKPLAKEQKIQEAIAKKAYELYEQSGKAEGRDVEHWLEAENLLKPKPRRKNTN